MDCAEGRCICSKNFADYDGNRGNGCETVARGAWMKSSDCPPCKYFIFFIKNSLRVENVTAHNEYPKRSWFFLIILYPPKMSETHQKRPKMSENVKNVQNVNKRYIILFSTYTKTYRPKMCKM